MSKVLAIVDRINDDLMEKQEGNSIVYDLIEFISNGDCEIINYCGITIWDSENSEVIEFYIEFERYIRDEINEINKKLGSIEV